MEIEPTYSHPPAIGAKDEFVVGRIYQSEHIGNNGKQLHGVSYKGYPK